MERMLSFPREVGIWYRIHSNTEAQEISRTEENKSLFLSPEGLWGSYYSFLTYGSYLIPYSSFLDVLALVKISRYTFSEIRIPKVWGPAFSPFTDSKPNWHHILKLPSSSCYQDISHWVRGHSYNGLSANWESKIVNMARKGCVK